MTRDHQPSLNRQYRSHCCGDVTESHQGSEIRLAGWIHAKRDHGNLLFVDVRDHSGVMQCVCEERDTLFATMQSARVESAVSLAGVVALRDEETINRQLPTGTIELRLSHCDILGQADVLPFQIATPDDAPEDVRLQYRFLDVRRASMRAHLVLRSAVIASLRRRMAALGFMEIQTPILTASSPEGARDYLVPSRLHQGCFYALPQAPQIFKQLLMVGGFERYFQIAPCFRDEDARSDRSPGEFYQLDFEMAFATQDDVFAVLEDVLGGVFDEFAADARVTSTPFPRFTYEQADDLFASDKPDLRNPLRLADVTPVFAESGFSLFARVAAQGETVRAIGVSEAGTMPRAWFDRMNQFARDQGQGGLGYIAWENGEAKGPIANHLEEERMIRLQNQLSLKENDAVFFVAGAWKDCRSFAALARERLCDEMKLREQNSFCFCWVIDYPMYELSPETGEIIFSHNPFSMPQGELAALENENPLTIKAWQYDIVCNGVELSSGAIRNHRPDVMAKAFAIAGYSEEDITHRFGALWRAFHYGAPPHGGAAPGIDRMVMLLAQTDNLRDVIAFPMNGQAKDMTLGAPSPVSTKQLEELGLVLAKQARDATIIKKPSPMTHDTNRDTKK